MIKNIFSDKKAEISTTLTWFFAIFIIVFIIFIYLFFTFGILGKNFVKNLVSGEQNGIIIEGGKGNSEEIIILNELISFLNTKRENEYYSDIKELIVYSVQPFIDDEELMQSINGDINNLDSVYSTLDKEKYSEGLKRGELLISESKYLVNKKCPVYNLKVPQGFIFPKDYSLTNSNIVWSDWTQIKIPYRDNLIEVKYRRSINC